MGHRREYSISEITVNGIKITSVIIDEHLDKHSEHINDELVLKIVHELDGEEEDPSGENGNYKYYASKVFFEEKWYRLVWCLEDGKFYIGVITLFRDKGIKNERP